VWEEPDRFSSVRYRKTGPEVRHHCRQLGGPYRVLAHPTSIEKTVPGDPTVLSSGSTATGLVRSVTLTEPVTPRSPRAISPFPGGRDVREGTRPKPSFPADSVDKRKELWQKESIDSSPWGPFGVCSVVDDLLHIFLSKKNRKMPISSSSVDYWSE
jgi:hypothetical protein